VCSGPTSRRLFGAVHVDRLLSVPLKLVAILDPARWADEIAALDAGGPLPRRLALVPSEPHAHALRVELLARAPGALVGTQFLTATAAAAAVLDHVGAAYRLGEEVRRPLRIRAFLRGSPSLEYYRADSLRSAGWDQALAEAIEQLEAAALRPEHLVELDDSRARDLAAIWRGVDAAAGASTTRARLVDRAGRLLAETPPSWPFDAPVLAAVSASIDRAHARLLLAIPGVTLGVRPGRPAGQHLLERIRALLGPDIAALIERVPSGPTAPSSELGRLHASLFLASEARGTGPDGTVSLELHAGVDEELDAAARWVAECVYVARLPLQDIAVLVPDPDPLATLVADRIRGLPWPHGVDPVYLRDGLPAVGSSAGAAVASLLRSLTDYLPADALAELLPRVRRADDRGGLSHRQARDVVRSLGTAGGSRSRPGDALAWRVGLASPGLSIAGREVALAIDELVAIAAAMLAGAPLRVLWTSVRGFAASQLIGLGPRAEVLQQLDDDLAELADDAVTAAVTGADAIELLASRLRAIRLPRGRFGDPAIYVGSVAGAAGLRFRAVRVLGLAEGAFPGTLRANAILPLAVRERLPAFAMPAPADYAAARLHALDQVVRGTADVLALSAPRIDLDGGERAPAALFVDVGAALGRPNAATGAPAPAVPTLAQLDRDAFRVARIAARRRRHEAPLTAACWIDRVARDPAALPTGWSAPSVIAPQDVLGCDPDLSGVLGPAPVSAVLPGDGPERPLAVTALRDLLACPQRFLLEHVLGFAPREASRETHRVDRATYGRLVHQIAEAFAVQHGAELGRRRDGLEHWLAVADREADRWFDELVRTYPLLGPSALETQRRRLRRDLGGFVTDEWNAGVARTFVAAERVFGTDPVVSVATPAGPLFLSGRIDRIDLEENVVLVRDLKTGRARPRDPDTHEPEVDVDVQLAAYVTVASQLATVWGLPADVAGAYVYVDPRAPIRERAYRDDRGALHAAGRRWIELAAALLRDHAFVRTPRAEDCERCPFRPVCGDRAEATARWLHDAGGTLGAFRELKT
jgi:hypothetical protein